MVSLLSICLKYLQSHLDLYSLDHCLDVRTSAKHIQQRDLVSSLDDHIGRSFMKIVRSSVFKNLTEDKLATLVSLDSLVVADEDCVFESVQTWISEDQNIRSKSFPRLLQLVRICFLSPDYLNGTVKPFIREMRNILVVTNGKEEEAVVVDSFLSPSDETDSFVVVVTVVVVATTVAPSSPSTSSTTLVFLSETWMTCSVRTDSSLTAMVT